MPHLSGVDINAISSVAAWRFVAGSQGVSGINSLLSQVGGGSLGYSLANKGDAWEFYSASGDSYDVAHQFFGGTVYAIGATALQTPGVLASLEPVSEEFLMPDEEPPPDAPEVPEGVGLSGVGGLGVAVSGLAAASEVVSWFGSLITNLSADGPSIQPGLGGGQGGGLTEVERNPVARMLGFRVKGSE